MGEKIWNILVLCTGNSARSLIGEALLNHLGGGRIKAHSAGSHPAGAPHPDALAVLKAHGVPAEALRSKHWNDFSVPGAPEMDVVLTVCDRAASEACPVWPGAPVACHWGLPVGLQLVGPPRGEARLLAAAALIERVFGIADQLPIEPRPAGGSP